MPLLVVVGARVLRSSDRLNLWACRSLSSDSSFVSGQTQPPWDPERCRFTSRDRTMEGRNDCGIQVVGLPLRGTLVNTEVIEMEARHENSDQHPYTMVLFPGNPSVLPYYRPFMDLLHQRLGTKVPVHAVSHSGFGEKDHNDGELFDIEDQVALKLAYLDRLRQQRPDHKFVLVGHSLGAYVMMQVLSRNNDLPVSFSFFLFPTLLHLEVAFPVRVLQIPVVREAVTSVLNILPAAVKRSVVKMIPSIRDEAQMLVDYFHSTTLRNVLHLTRHELETIRELSETDVDTLRRHQHKSFYMFTTRDHYVPPHVFDAFVDHVPDAQMHVYDDVEHSFVVGDAYTRVAEKMLEQLAEVEGFNAVNKDRK